MSPGAMVPQTGFRATGVLILVVGPSGAGKDSIIIAARRAFEARRDVVFPQRIVTRKVDPEIEDHATVSMSDFEALEAGGAFAASWRAHGHAYGVPGSIGEDLSAGRVVVVNVSRGAIAGLRHRFSRVHVVHLSAASDVLAARLRARGRETDSEIARRVARAESAEIPAPPMSLLDNSGALADAVDGFLKVLAGYVPLAAGRSD